MKIRYYDIVNNLEGNFSSIEEAGRSLQIGSNRLSAQLRKNNGTYFAKFSGYFFDTYKISDEEWNNKKQEYFLERIVLIDSYGEEKYFKNITELANFLDYKDIPTLSNHVKNCDYIKGGIGFREKDREKVNFQNIIEKEEIPQFTFNNLENIPNINGIYKITCKSNNKCYIGKSVNLNKRLHNHYYDLTNNKHHSIYLQNSFNKYGVNDFIINIVIAGKFTQEELSDLEKKYINYYDSYHNGFNMQ